MGGGGEAALKNTAIHSPASAIHSICQSQLSRLGGSFIQHQLSPISSVFKTI
jgi:hypothetical protein